MRFVVCRSMFGIRVGQVKKADRKRQVKNAGPRWPPALAAADPEPPLPLPGSN